MLHTSMIDALDAISAPHSAVLGIDVGEKTIGLAIADIRLPISSPLFTLHRRNWRTDVRTLGETIVERKVGGCIIGLPLFMDGRESPKSQSARAFGRNLFAVFPTR